MPTLTFEALKEQVAARRLAPVHVFWGTDVQLMARMVDAVEATIDEADRVFAVDRLYAAENGGGPVDVVAAAQSLPMLGDRRLVFVLRAERFLKPKRAGKADKADEDDGEAPPGEPDGPIDTTPLEEYLAAPSTTTTLVFVAAEIDRTRRLTKRLLDRAQVTEFGADDEDPKRPGGNLAHVLRGTLAREGRTIDRDAAALLLRWAGGSVTKLRDDLEKVVLFVGSRARITEDDVMAVSAERDAVSDEWAITSAMAAGDAAGALRELGKRLDRGDSVFPILGQIRWWVSAKLALAEAARAKPAIEAVLRADIALKSSGIDPRVQLERLVVELTGRPIPNQRWGR